MTDDTSLDMFICVFKWKYLFTLLHNKLFMTVPCFVIPLDLFNYMNTNIIVNNFLLIEKDVIKEYLYMCKKILSYG